MLKKTIWVVKCKHIYDLLLIDMLKYSAKVDKKMAI